MSKAITDQGEAYVFMMMHPKLYNGSHRPLFWWEEMGDDWKMGLSKSDHNREPVGDFDVTAVASTIEDCFVPLANLVLEVYGDYRGRLQVPGLN